MDYTKYSKQEFVKRGLDSSEALKLANKLQEDVAKELHEAVLVKFLEIVNRLNNHGHNLTSYGEINIGDISYRDEPIEGYCYLRLACDVVISTGYAHTQPPTKAIDN